MINGIHHVSFRCSGEQLRRVITFYSDTLGIPLSLIHISEPTRH